MDTADLARLGPRARRDEHVQVHPDPGRQRYVGGRLSRAITDRHPSLGADHFHVSTQTGDYDCSAGTLDNEMLYAAGVGTDDLDFPPGVAMHIAAGTYINLNLHLFNASDIPISGTSGVLVKIVQQADVVHEADMMFSGSFLINVPSDNPPHVVHGQCKAPTDWHIFTLWPHMHQTATHQKWTYTEGTNPPVTLLDDDFLFAEQKNYPIPDTLLKSGDKIDTYCTYVNNTGHTMTFGDGSDKEMCFTGMYKYPAGGNLFSCAMGQ